MRATKNKTNRVLTEGEIDEQLRLQIKKELLAYAHDSMPRSPKIDDMIDMWKQINIQFQIQCSERNRMMRFLGMLPKDQRLEEVKRLRRFMLFDGESN